MTNKSPFLSLHLSRKQYSSFQPANFLCSIKLMAFSSVSKLNSFSKINFYRSFAFSTSAAIDKFYKLLQENGSAHVEKSLNKLSGTTKLDALSVNEVLKLYSTNSNSLLGAIRFFIWSVAQSNSRPSSYSYAKACNFLKLKQNPGAIAEVIECYKIEKCAVSVKTFKAVLSLCKEAKLADEALLVLRKMVEFNCRPNNVIYNVVIRLFCEKGDVNMAGKLLEEMSVIGLFPDMVTYSLIVKAFCDAGRVADAWELVKVMKETGCVPNAVTYSALLDGVCRSGNLDRAVQLLGEMEKEGGDCSPNAVTYTSVIQALCEKGKSIEAIEVLDRMVSQGCSPNRVTVSVLIEGLCAEHRVDEVSKVIGKVEEQSVSKGECYSSLVVSLLKIGKYQDAEEQFKGMLSSGIKADGLSCSLMIKQLCKQGRFLDAYNLYDAFEKTGFVSSIDSDIYSIILDGLCQQSHSVEAAGLARLMLERRILLKASYVDRIVEHLTKNGDRNLVMKLTTFT